MRERTRKFIGATVMVGFVIVYALVVMALAQAQPVQTASWMVQALFYAVAGLLWVLPILPLIRWMEKR
jgi:hypothetical protein